MWPRITRSAVEADRERDVEDLEPRPCPGVEVDAQRAARGARGPRSPTHHLLLVRVHGVARTDLPDDPRADAAVAHALDALRDEPLRDLALAGGADAVVVEQVQVVAGTHDDMQPCSARDPLQCGGVAPSSTGVTSTIVPAPP
jgi:hypothetical protein